MIETVLSVCLFSNSYNISLWEVLNKQVGAPPEVVARLEQACSTAANMGHSAATGCIGEDPALDQFMEAYCEMLTKYEQELSKPFKEAMLFLQRIECQFKALAVSSSDSGDYLYFPWLFYILHLASLLRSFVDIFSIYFLDFSFCK